MDLHFTSTYTCEVTISPRVNGGVKKVKVEYIDYYFFN